MVDLSGGGGGGGSLGELVANIIVTAINSAAADYVEYARVANYRFINTLPYGPYHPLYMKDQDMQIVDPSSLH